MVSEMILPVPDPVTCIFLDYIDFYAETDMYLLFLPFHFCLFYVILYVVRECGNSKQQKTWSEAK